MFSSFDQQDVLTFQVWMKKCCFNRLSGSVNVVLIQLDALWSLHVFGQIGSDPNTTLSAHHSISFALFPALHSPH